MKPQKKARTSGEKFEMTTIRYFDAPVSVVFAAWTDPKEVAQWWGPDGFTTTMVSWEPFPHGKILLYMNAPDGTVYPMGGDFVDLTPPNRFSFKARALDEKGSAMFENLNSVTLEQDGGRTKLTLHVKVLSMGPGAEMFLKGMDAGWSQSLDRLNTYIAAKAK